MGSKKKGILVYCPKCGEVSNASLLYCEHCKESLRGAAEVDPSEAKVKKKRERRIKRDTKHRARKAKKEALFEKAPILKPLYYMLWTGIVIGIISGLVQLFKVSELAGVSVLTVAFISFYGWYAPILIDNADYFDGYIEQLPKIARARERMVVHRFIWGLVIGGLFIAIGLLSLVWTYIMDMLG